MITAADGTQNAVRVVLSCDDLLRPGGLLPPPGTSLTETQQQQFQAAAAQQLVGACAQIQANQFARKANAMQAFTLPGSLVHALGAALTVGLMLVAVLAGGVVGSEYAGGTLRPVLVRGVGRWNLFTAKFGVLFLAAGLMLLVVGAVSMLSSWAAGTLIAEDDLSRQAAAE
jgi:hypothetical protein